MSADATFQPSDYLKAHDLCDFIGKNMEIEFQIGNDQFTRQQAEKHFTQRQALIVVRTMLLDEGERILKGIKP